MTFEKVRSIIVETIKCDAGDISMETSLAEDLSIDSIDAVELSMALEEAFGVAIPDTDMAELTRVSDIVSYIERKEMECA